MRYVAYGIGIITGLLGLLFILSLGSAQNTNPVGKAIVGIVLVGISAGLIWYGMKKAPDRVKRIEITQKVDLAGDTELERLTCKSCGGVLESSNVHVAQDGSVMVNCPYCNSAYQITEKPTW